MDYQSMQIVTSPEVQPLTLAEAKEHLRMDTSDEDTLIEALISAATDHVSGRNGYTARALVQQTWDVYFSTFPDDVGLKLPFPPLISVDSISYLDADGVSQTLATSVYMVTKTEPAFVKLKANQSWPDVLEQADCITVRMTCGYSPGDDSPTDYAENVPQSIKAAMKLVIGDLYQNREAAALVSGAKYEPNPAVKALLNPYRVDMGL